MCTAIKENLYYQKKAIAVFQSCIYMHGEYAAHAVPALTVTLRSLLILLRDRAFIQVICNDDMQLTTNLPGNKKSSVLRTNRKTNE
jgi:hypothetical protein